MAKKDEEEKRGFVGGLVNDLAMGLGLRDRDQSYYDRTAATIGRNQGQDAAARYSQQMSAANFPARGGLLSAFGVTGPRDFFDGGGLGRSGDTFQGSPYSILLNALGVKPYGYAERQGRADQAIADLQNPAKWMAGYGGGDTRISTKSVAPDVTPKDYSVYGDIDFPMYVPQTGMATGPEYSGTYPQAAYEAGFDDIFLNNLKQKDPENFAFIMSNYGVAGY